MNVNNTQFNQSVLETNKTTIENVTGSLTVNNDGSCLFAYLDPNIVFYLMFVPFL